MPNRGHFIYEDEQNKGIYHFGGIKQFGERYPTTVDRPNYGKPKNIKSGSINPADIGAGTYAILRDPYTWPMKVRFEESYRMDPVVRSAINRKVAFILGKKFDTTFDIIDSFMNAHEARSAINIIASDQEYFNAKRIVDKVMRRVNFQQKLKGAVIQSKVYGRSALLVEATPEEDGGDGFPDNIKILNSKLLGQVRIDEYTWQLQQIQYNTNSRGLNDPYNFLDAADIIYFTNLDYHISPYTIHYGLSDIEPIAHISEVNRILNEEDLKETNVGMWAGYGLIKIPSFRNPAEVQAFLGQFQPGKWSAISQDIQVEVHELSGDIGHLINERNENEKLILRALNVPSMILGFEDVQNYACVSYDTETLTENGWKYYWEIKENEKIATVNPDNGELEYHIPDGFYLYDFDGEMVRFKSENQDFLVTPNHRMWLTHNNGKQWYKKQAQEIEHLKRVDFMASVAWEGVEVDCVDIPTIEYSKFCAPCNRQTQVQCIKMDDWLEFLGYFISEGGILTKSYRRSDRPDLRNAQFSHTITILQNINNHKNGGLVCQKIDSCLERLPFRFHSYVDRDYKHWQLQNKQLHAYLKSFGEGGPSSKYIPRWIFKLGRRQLRILFDSLMLGDGHYRKNGSSIVYGTTSKQLASDVQELAIKLGYSASVWGPHYDKRTDYIRKPMYHVNIHTARRLATVYDIHRECYKGKVYCFNVKNHLFVVRRNGKVGITHNTAQEVMLAWKESVIEEERSWVNQILEPQWFDTLLAKALNIEDITKLKVKMMLEFEDIAFENLKDKVLAVLPLYEAGLIPADKVLEFLGFDDVVDQLADLQTVKQQAAQQMGQVANEQAQSDKPVPVTYPSMSPKSLLTQVEKNTNQNPNDNANPL